MSAAVVSPAEIRRSNFTRYAWGLLAWNIGVVLWGAYVRASGSGAGCGNNWPLCNGAVLPPAPGAHTVIEFSHRVSTGVAGFAILGLLLWSFFLFPRWHRVQKAALAAVAFLIVEIALGAGLVLLQYVEANASAGRAVYLSMHLVNTQLLLATLALTAWFAREPQRRPGNISKLLKTALAAALLVSVSGAIAALGDTLFPSSSFSEGFRQDLSGSGHFLLRLRIFHPALAILGGVFIAALAVRTLRSNPQPTLNKIGLAVLSLTVVQLGAGAINLALLAPIWMQILHLLLADLVWISLVLMTAETSVPMSGDAARKSACATATF